MNKKPSYDLTTKDGREKNKKAAKKANYVKETTYDGTGDAAKIPYQMWEVPEISEEDKASLLEHTTGTNANDISDLVLTNKQYTKKVGEDRINTIKDSAVKFVKDELYSSSDVVAKDSVSYVNTLLGQIAMRDYSDKDNETSTDFANRIAEMYVDNNIKTKGEFLSDKSLVYNFAYYNMVRGYGKLTVTSKDHKTGEECKPFSDLLGHTVKYGEETEFYCEAMLTDEDTPKVVEVDFYGGK